VIRQGTGQESLGDDRVPCVDKMEDGRVRYMPLAADPCLVSTASPNDRSETTAMYIFSRKIKQKKVRNRSARHRAAARHKERRRYAARMAG